MTTSEGVGSVRNFSGYICFLAPNPGDPLSTDELKRRPILRLLPFSYFFSRGIYTHDLPPTAISIARNPTSMRFDRSETGAVPVSITSRDLRQQEEVREERNNDDDQGRRGAEGGGGGDRKSHV